MNAGDLIKQKKDRVVYNSIQGQTKPANKTTPKTFDVVLQHRLGPKKVYSGKQVVLPACDCTVLPPNPFPLFPNITAMIGGMGIIGGTDSGQIVVQNVPLTFQYYQFPVPERIINIFTPLDLWFITTRGVYVYSPGPGPSTSFTTPSGVVINSAAIDPGNSNYVYLATSAGIYYTDDGGLDWYQISSMDTTSFSAVASDGTNIYVSSGNKIYYTPVSLVGVGASFTDTNYAQGIVKFLVYAPDSSLWIATDTDTYQSTSLPDLASLNYVSQTFTGTISCLAFPNPSSYPLMIGTTTGEVQLYGSGVWTAGIPIPTGKTVNTLVNNGGDIYAGTTAGIFSTSDPELTPWTAFTCVV